MHQSEAKFAKLLKCHSIVATIRDKVKSERAKQYVCWVTNNKFLQMERGYSRIPPLIIFDDWMKVRLNPTLLAPTRIRSYLLVEIAKEIDTKFG